MSSSYVLSMLFGENQHGKENNGWAGKEQQTLLCLSQLSLILWIMLPPSFGILVSTLFARITVLILNFGPTYFRSFYSKFLVMCCIIVNPITKTDNEAWEPILLDTKHVTAVTTTPEVKQEYINY